MAVFLNRCLYWLSLILIPFLVTSCASKSEEKEVAEPLQIKEVNQDLPVGDNSRNALDWPGTYIGDLPCADCDRIETTIVLNSDNTYEFTALYIGKEKPIVLEHRGAFTWSADGGKISLNGMKEGPSQFLVGENKLIQLDLNGERITGALATKYELIKQP